jgi:cysteine desulfurase
MPADSIYLDNNATTPIDPRVVEAMTRAWRDCGANPASQHTPGRRARRMLEEAREGILELLGAKTGGMDADQLIFTSGGTEANNLAILGLPIAGGQRASGGSTSSPARIAVSALEHPSVTGAVNERSRRDRIEQFHTTRVLLTPPDTHGIVCAAAATDLAHFGLFSIQLANNETGVIQPVAEIAALCHERGSLVHTDAVQAVGKIPVSFRELGVDAMTVAPHKFHGPLGIGALVLKHGVKLQPQLFGGFQQGGLRPGTENVALAVGFHEALNLAIRELPERSARMQRLRDQLEGTLLDQGRPEARPTIIGAAAPRLPNTSCVSFLGLDRQALVMALDLAGVACSTGSACASGSSEPSPALIAMGLPHDVIQGAIRFSLGAFTTAAEVAEAARRILNTVNHLRSQKSG